MVSNKYHRDFNSYGALKRPGRIDRTVFQDIPDCGDGFGGIQWMMLKAFGTLLFPRFVIEGCEYNGVDTMSNGYILHDGIPIEVLEQAIVVANGEFLYINQNGVANTTAVQATAEAEIMIYERDALAVGYDIRFRLIDNAIKVFGLDAQYLRIHHDVVIDEDVSIGGDLDVDGDTTLDDTEIDGTLNVTGVTDMQDDLEMNDNEIKDIKQMDGGGDPIILDDEFNMNTNQISNMGDPVDLQDAVTLAYLRNMFLPIGTILMYDGVLWVDNTLMPGWYKCDGNNGTPDLEEKFVRGDAASGAGAGQDEVTLAANQIPTHTTAVGAGNHTHTLTTGTQSANHDHSGTTGTQSVSHTHTMPLGTGLGGTRTIVTATYAGMGSATGNQSASHTHSIPSIINDASHTHSGTSANQVGTHTHTYTPVGFANVPTIPAYYKVIFIMRIA